MAQTKITSYSRKPAKAPRKAPQGAKKAAKGKGPYPGAVDTGMRVYRRKNGTLFTR